MKCCTVVMYSYDYGRYRNRPRNYDFIFYYHSCLDSNWSHSGQDYLTSSHNKALSRARGLVVVVCSCFLMLSVGVLAGVKSLRGVRQEPCTGLGVGLRHGASSGADDGGEERRD